MSSTPKLGIQLLATNTAQKEVVINEALITFDAMLSRTAKNRVNGPPANPTSGDLYIVGTAPTGVWATHANKLAFYFNGWRYIQPTQKLKFYNEAASAFWTYTSGNWAQDPAGTPAELGDLTNVQGAPLNGYVLTYDSSTGYWVPQPPSAVLSLSDLEDVNASPANGQVLAWSAVTSKWVAMSLPSGGSDRLQDLSDVTMGSNPNGKFLRWGGTGATWENTPAPPMPELGDLTDVHTASAETGDVLAWNGAAWGPSPAVITYSFLGMVDGPMTFDGHAGKFLVVDDTESEMRFAGVEEVFQVSAFKVQNLGDVPAPSDAHIGKYLRFNKVGGVYSFSYETPTDTKVEAFNGSTSLTAALTRLTFEGFDVASPAAGQVTITAKNALGFEADGDPLIGEASAINFTGDGVGVTLEDGLVTVTIENGGGSIETLSDVDLTVGPTDRQALVFDAATQKWVAGDAVGGGHVVIDGEAEPALYEMGAFAPPTPSMFPLRWNSPSADLTQVPNRGLMVQPGPQLSGVRHAGVMRNLSNSTAPWRVSARMIPNGFPVSGHASGLYLQRAANSATAFLMLGSNRDDNGWVVRFGHVSAAGVETITATETNEYPWLRLSYDGNNILGWVSTDGLIWHSIGSLAAATVLGGPPNRVGVGNRSNQAHSGDVGVLITNYDDPDFPAASRIQQGVVSLGVAGLQDVDLETVAPTGGQALIWNGTNGKWVPGDASGVSALSALTDVDLSVPPEGGNALVWDNVSGKWVAGAGGGGGAGGIATDFDIAIFVPDTPAPETTVVTYLAPREFNIPAGFEFSSAYAEIAPSGAVVFTIKHNGVSVGTLSFAMGVNTGVFASSSAINCVSGDRLSVVAPIGLQGLTDLTLSIIGSRV